MADNFDIISGKGTVRIASTVVDGANQLVTSSTFDGAMLDAFGRLRISQPFTLFDSKQIFDNAPLFWDDQEESGGGSSSTHSVPRASSVLASTLNTACVRTRQTFQRFNYQPGKSQRIDMTGILDKSGGGSGVTRRIGYFDDDNGLFFEDDEGTVKVVVRSNATGSPVNTKVTQASWNVDPMDGTGPSGITTDWTKAQIFGIDFEWLGVGSVRFYLVVGGALRLVHQVDNANVLDVVYASTPNLPLRYQLVTTGTSAASEMECICASVISEGGQQDTGALFSESTSGTEINANGANTLYAAIGIRLKAANLGCTVNLESVSIIAETNDDFEWSVYINPTVTGTFTYADVTNSCVQTALSTTNPAATMSGGTRIGVGVGKSSTAIGEQLSNAIRLGAAIDGTVDEIVIGARSFTSNADFQAGIVWRELL